MTENIQDCEFTESHQCLREAGHLLGIVFAEGMRYLFVYKPSITITDIIVIRDTL